MNFRFAMNSSQDVRYSFSLDRYLEIVIKTDSEPHHTPLLSMGTST